MYELPAYLVWGFLESGKSTLIKETLNQDYFNDGEENNDPYVLKKEKSNTIKKC